MSLGENVLCNNLYSNIDLLGIAMNSMDAHYPIGSGLTQKSDETKKFGLEMFSDRTRQFKSPMDSSIQPNRSNTTTWFGQ